MRSQRLLVMCMTAFAGFQAAQAYTTGFLMPLELQGFKDMGNFLPQDSPIRAMMKRDPDACGAVELYRYSDNALATAGLAEYLKRLDMTFKEIQRTQMTVTWSAKSDSAELVGVWRAQDGGGGTLELCGQGYSRASSSGSGGSIGGLGFGGFGGLGLLMWYLRRRLSR